MCISCNCERVLKRKSAPSTSIVGTREEEKKLLEKHQTHSIQNIDRLIASSIISNALPVFALICVYT